MNKQLKYLLIAAVVFLAMSCKKLHKKAQDMIPNHTWEIVGMTLDGEDVLAEFYEDSCFCKKMYFSTVESSDYPHEYSVYFKECNQVSTLFSSAGPYSILESESVKPRKYAFMAFNNFSQSVNACTCGRWGYASYYTITAVDTKKNTWQMVADLPDGRWQIDLKLSE